MRYFPESYKRIKPLNVVFDKYYPLKCEICDKDLLESMFVEKMNGVVVFVLPKNIDNNKNKIEDIYIAFKGMCDEQKRKYYESQGFITCWGDILDLVNPLLFMQYIISILNNFNAGTISYSEKAFKKEKDFILKLSQKVLIQMNEEERNRAKNIFELGFIDL